MPTDVLPMSPNGCYLCVQSIHRGEPRYAEGPAVAGSGPPVAGSVANRPVFRARTAHVYRAVGERRPRGEPRYGAGKQP